MLRFGDADSPFSSIYKYMLFPSSSPIRCCFTLLLDKFSLLHLRPLFSLGYLPAFGVFFFSLAFFTFAVITMSSSSYSSPSIYASSPSTSSQSSEENILTILGECHPRVPHHLVVYPDQRVDPASPSSSYKTVYSSSFGAGFRGNLSWLMMDYCELL